MPKNYIPQGADLYESVGHDGLVVMVYKVVDGRAIYYAYEVCDEQQMNVTREEVDVLAYCTHFTTPTQCKGAAIAAIANFPHRRYTRAKPDNMRK